MSMIVRGHASTPGVFGCAVRQHSKRGSRGGTLWGLRFESAPLPCGGIEGRTTACLAKRARMLHNGLAAL